MDLHKLRDDLCKIELYFVKCANNAAIGSSADKKFRSYVHSVGDAIKLIDEKINEQKEGST